jgi:hypothetical protein
MAAIETNNLQRVIATQAITPTTALTIGKIGFGESGELPNSDDTALKNPYIKNVSSKKLNSDNSLTFEYDLGYDEANGKVIKEIGLYCMDGVTLVAREARDTTIKDQDTAVSGKITILL